MRRFAIAVAVLSFAAASFAQPVTVGKLFPHLDAFYGGSAPTPFTFVDVAHPAQNSGNLTEGPVYWGSTQCSGAFTLVFLEAGFGQTLTGYQVYAHRGPFNATNGFNVVTLSPPVPIAPGDLIAITVNKPVSGCGNVWGTRRTGEQTFLVPNDMTGANAMTFGTLVTGANVNVFASGSSTTTTGYVPAAGAVAGAFGSFFRTSLQLTNQLPNTVTGKLIFHRAGASGSPSDPSLPFTVGAGKTVSYADVVTQMQQTGVGSMDIVTNDGVPLTAYARTFNDLGSGGTLGFAEEIVEPEDALQFGQSGTLTLPADQTNFRTNLGFRTLDDGATLNLSIVDANGTVVASTSKTFQPNWFEQNSAASYFHAASLPAGGTITATVIGGEAIVYGSITDNRANDSSLHYLRP